MSKNLFENSSNPIRRSPNSLGTRSGAKTFHRHSEGLPHDSCLFPDAPKEQRATIYLVDGNSRRRAAIVHDISGFGRHVEPFGDADELIRSRPNPGMFLVCDEDGAIATLTNHMATSGAWFPIVAFSERPDTPSVVKAMQVGAVDYIDWPIIGAELVQRIRDADGAVTKIAFAKLREGAARSRTDRLTKREREVLVCVADGMSNRAVAEQLRISPRTVEIHRANMLKKIDASNTPDAIRIALQAGLID